MLSLETFDREIDKKLPIGPTVEAKEVAQRVRKKWKNLGLTIDLSHIPLIGESIEEALTTAKDYLIHIYIGNCILKDRNNPRYGDKHPPFGVEGGEIDVPQVAEFLKILKEIGYFSKAKDGEMPVVSFEVKPSEEAAQLLTDPDRHLLFHEVRVDVQLKQKLLADKDAGITILEESIAALKMIKPEWAERWRQCVCDAKIFREVLRLYLDYVDGSLTLDDLRRTRPKLLALAEHGTELVRYSRSGWGTSAYYLAQRLCRLFSF